MDSSENIIKFIHTIPIFMKLEENNTIINGNIYKLLLYNIWLCVIKSYIITSQDMETYEFLERKEEEKVSSDLISDEELFQINRGKMEKRNKKVCNLLKVFLQLSYKQKEKIYNFSNEDIKYKILQANNKEKEKIKKEKLKRKEEMLARKKALAESQLSQQDKENNELEAKQKLEKQRKRDLKVNAFLKRQEEAAKKAKEKLDKVTAEEKAREKKNGVVS
jgi:hypothetical protein